MKTKLRNLLLLFLFVILVYSVSALSDTITQSIFGGKEQHSPGDWIKEDQIKVYQDRVILEIPNAIWAGFTDTNSMDPLIDIDSNAIEIIPQSPDLIQPGDVISYQTEQGVIIHRVIKKDEDNQGIYYTVKGDNNTFADPVRVRFDDVKGVVVAVIY